MLQVPVSIKRNVEAKRKKTPPLAYIWLLRIKEICIIFQGWPVYLLCFFIFCFWCFDIRGLGDSGEIAPSSASQFLELGMTSLWVCLRVLMNQSRVHTPSPPLQVAHSGPLSLNHSSAWYQATRNSHQYLIKLQFCAGCGNVYTISATFMSFIILWKLIS